MRIYSTADIHGSQFRLNTALDSIQSYKPDLVIICGDITQFGPGDVAKNFLDQIPGTIYTVHGNIDSDDAIRGITQSHAENIHMKKIVFNGISFVGINGVNSRDTDLFFSSDSYVKLLDGMDVLVSHVPPYGFQDKVFLGKHSGSKELFEIIKKYQPKLVLCGHIHEDPGISKYNDTIIVNCSIGKTGNGALIEFDKTINVKMLK
jgi:Icc-related predicted phosphoesterase